MGTSKHIKILILIIAIPLVFTACKKAGGDYPGDQYTFDMISSRAYETYSLNKGLRDSMSAILPVVGTVPYMGNAIAGTSGDSNHMALNLPYTIPHTAEGYERAGVELVNPFKTSDEKVIADGKHFYNIYCAICHGVEGNGKGNIVASGKYPGVPPSYFEERLLTMPGGKMFHSVTYGINAMQSYAYALSKEERWEVITYIKSLQEAHIAGQPIAVE